MTRRVAALAVALLAASGGGSAQPRPDEPSLDVVLGRAAEYVRQYEERFSLLVAEEHYVQEVLRPIMSTGNLSRTNPGGGMASGGGVQRHQELRSDYLLVRLGGGGGWMPFRDTFEVNGKKVADRDDRLAKLFLDPSTSSLDQASRIMADSTRHNLGTLQRTVNIPTLALMFLHPEIRGRFDFSRDGTEAIGDRVAWTVDYHERQLPTLIRTSRGRDLRVTGRLWIDPATGVVLKTSMTAADIVVRAVVTTTYREDPTVQFWVPDRMEDYYKVARDVDEIQGTATYSNFRRFTVNTDEALRKPPPE